MIIKKSFLKFNAPLDNTEYTFHPFNEKMCHLPESFGSNFADFVGHESQVFDSRQVEILSSQQLQSGIDHIHLVHENRRKL